MGFAFQCLGYGTDVDTIRLFLRLPEPGHQHSLFHTVWSGRQGWQGRWARCPEKAELQHQLQQGRGPLPCACGTLEAAAGWKELGAWGLVSCPSTRLPGPAARGFAQPAKPFGLHPLENSVIHRLTCLGVSSCIGSSPLSRLGMFSGSPPEEGSNEHSFTLGCWGKISPGPWVATQVLSHLGNHCGFSRAAQPRLLGPLPSQDPLIRLGTSSLFSPCSFELSRLRSAYPTPGCPADP